MTVMTGPGGVVGTPPAATPLTSKAVGAILTGERMALGRGRLPEFLTVETIWTGPPPPPPLPLLRGAWSTSMASSSEPLERSLPDSAPPVSLLLEDDDVVEEEEELRLSLPRPPLAPVSSWTTGMRGGMLEAEIVVTWTLPMLETRRFDGGWDEDKAEDVVGGAWTLVSAGIGLLTAFVVVVIVNVLLGWVGGAVGVAWGVA